MIIYIGIVKFLRILIKNLLKFKFILRMENNMQANSQVGTRKDIATYLPAFQLAKKRARYYEQLYYVCIIADCFN